MLTWLWKSTGGLSIGRQPALPKNLALVNLSNICPKPFAEKTELEVLLLVFGSMLGVKKPLFMSMNEGSFCIQYSKMFFVYYPTSSCCSKGSARLGNRSMLWSTYWWKACEVRQKLAIKGPRYKWPFTWALNKSAFSFCKVSAASITEKFFFSTF